MLRRKKLTIEDEHVDRVGGEVLLAAKVNEDEIAAAAGSVDLYDRLRVRIASGWGLEAPGKDWHAPASIERGNAGVPFGVRPSLRWTLAVAAAILLLIAVTLPMWLPKLSSDRARIGQPAPQPTAPASPGGVESGPLPKHEPASLAVIPSRPRQSQGASHRHPRSNYHAGEVATDFLPLTFLADSAAQESGHVVRMRVPRSALIAFGVPMNVDRVSELIVADVVIGDDGLARAIRFIQ
jgi:hypothetical protein